MWGMFRRPIRTLTEPSTDPSTIQWFDHSMVRPCNGSDRSRCVSGDPHPLFLVYFYIFSYNFIFFCKIHSFIYDYFLVFLIYGAPLGPYGAPWAPWALADGPWPMDLGRLAPRTPPMGVYFRARGRWGPMGSMGLGDPPMGVSSSNRN